MKIYSQKDFAAGLLFTTVGSAFGWGALDYPLGHSARMGPGYFPLLLGGLLALLGLALMIRATAMARYRADPVIQWAWRPLLTIISANLLFGIALGGLPSIKLPALGLMAGVYLLTYMACLASERFRLVHATLLASLLALLSYWVFVRLLQLPMPVWPVWA